ncbi:hypothetical protein ACF3OC_08375 [Sphingobacterium cellulitidis]|uniref:hypothetical protein n=1 Tax=Sphingobacterium cellulitidis TaxID=1768011 RepID=UPI00370DBEB2
MVNEIIDNLDDLDLKFETYLSSLEFIEAGHFNMSNYEVNIDWSKIKCPGIYMISIHTDNSDVQVWIKNFKLLWEIEEYKWKFVPNTKKKRINMHLGTMDYLQLYLGKSQSIFHRVRQHIEAAIDKNTFALKLKMRENIQHVEYKLQYIPLPPSKHYEYICSRAEFYLRNKFNPIIGKQ